MKSTYQIHSLTTSAAAGSGTGHSSHRGGGNRGVSGGRERDEEEMDEYESSRSRKGSKGRRTAPLTDDDMVDDDEEGDYDDDEDDEENDEEEELYDEEGEEGEGEAEELDDEADEYADDGGEDDEEEPEYEEDDSQADETVADDDEYDALPLPLKPLPKTTKAPSQASTEQDHIPHKIECPTDYTQFNELLSTLAHSSDDVTTIINRILIYNSVHLPGALGKGNRELMHNFLEMLFKHFIRVADSLAQVTTCEDIAHVEKQVCHTIVYDMYVIVYYTHTLY